ncbi:MAG: zinc ribbon domain-containing protein [Chloroflexi bacterium]|nr:zinc ribbon domain-containing protein [Chloroflexota bacterium]
MDDNEVRARCGECGIELKQTANKCPNCGSTRKVYSKALGGTLELKGSLSAIHEFRWSGTAWTILGIFLTLWATIFFGLCFLNNLSLWANLLISLGIMSLLFLVIWLGRNQINKVLNWVERRFTGRKTYHSD